MVPSPTQNPLVPVGIVQQTLQHRLPLALPGNNPDPHPGSFAAILPSTPHIPYAAHRGVQTASPTPPVSQPPISLACYTTRPIDYNDASVKTPSQKTYVGSAPTEPFLPPAPGLSNDRQLLPAGPAPPPWDTIVYPAHSTNTPFVSIATPPGST